MGKNKTTRTVLFFDRKGFYKESRGKDPARLAEELDSFYKAIIDSAAEHSGEVVKFMGDAGLLLFTHPDDAVRFARSLLARPEYDSNVGIEHGQIVHGSFGKDPLCWNDAIGEPVNEAAVNMRRAAKGSKSIVLGPAAWEALSIEDREDIAKAEQV